MEALSKKAKIEEIFKGVLDEKLYSKTENESHEEGTMTVHVYKFKKKSGVRPYSALKERCLAMKGRVSKLSREQRADYGKRRQSLIESAKKEATLMYSLEGCSNIVWYLQSETVDWEDADEFGCSAVIEMPLMKGTVFDLIKYGKNFSEEDILNIGLQICTALVECHAIDIIHRDIKPENIFVDSKGNYALGDFSVSRELKKEQMATTKGNYTITCVAPEQVLENKHDHRVDIYSLGMVLYILWNNNCVPYAQEYNDISACLKRISNRLDLPIPESKLISNELAKIILKACKRNPDERYQTAQEFLDALTCVANDFQRSTKVPPSDEDVIPEVEKESETHIEQNVTEPARPRGEAKRDPLQIGDNYTGSKANKIEVRSPMPGTGFKVECKIGQEVYTGDILVILEWKKMEVEITAPSAGTVRFIADIIGKKINIDDLLIVLDTSREEVEQLIKVAQKGDSGALCKLGDLYMAGEGVKKDTKVAVEYYAQAAIYHANCEARYKLGLYYLNGLNLTRAISWLELASEQGHALAQYELGACYDFGKGVLSNRAEAMKWYTKAAEQGHSKALSILIEAANQGDVNAQVIVGECYAFGKGTSKDETEAVKWYKGAAEQGNSRAQFNLGLCYDFGKGVLPNRAEAMKWYTKAAEQGHSKALSILIEAANQGDVDAQVMVAKQFSKAAEQGDSDAQYKLGLCYMEGRGLPKDKAKAIDWFVEAIKNGNKKAQGALVECCSCDVWIDGKEVVRSPTSGNGYKVKCKVGQKVQAGDVLVVIEEIKLGFKVRALWSGTVQFVADIVGKSINTGDLLVILDRS